MHKAIYHSNVGALFLEQSPSRQVVMFYFKMEQPLWLHHRCTGHIWFEPKSLNKFSGRAALFSTCLAPF